MPEAAHGGVVMVIVTAGWWMLAVVVSSEMQWGLLGVLGIDDGSVKSIRSKVVQVPTRTAKPLSCLAITLPDPKLSIILAVTPQIDWIGSGIREGDRGPYRYNTHTLPSP